MKKTKLYVLVLLASVFSSCQREDFGTSGIIEDRFIFRNEKQSMPVTVAGNIDAKKMVLIIHGGPGGNGLDYRTTFVRNNVESEYAIVYWDQRYAGNTQGNGGPSHIDDFRDDIKKLIQLLKAKYGQDQEIFLFAHSWGGFLAPYFLVEPDNQAMVKGWIQIGGAHNYRMNDSLTREMLIKYSRQEIGKGNNTERWQEILDWCLENGFEGRENAGWLNSFAHEAEGMMDTGEPEFDLSFLSNHQSFISAFFNMMISAIRKIDEPTYETPISDQLHKINLPTLLLWGKYDFVCPLELAEDIEKNIGSSDIKKLIYNRSGHSPMMNEENAFWYDVLQWIGER